SRCDPYDETQNFSTAGIPRLRRLHREEIRMRRGALDVNLQGAAKQRSELSPRRGFASLGVRLVRLAEPRSGDRESVNKLEFVTGNCVAPSGLDHFRWFEP